MRYDFTTGNLPRRVTVRGDVRYLKDECDKQYLSVFPQAVLFLPTHLHGNCGGERLNQYTVTMEVMLPSLRPAAPTSKQAQSDEDIEAEMIAAMRASGALGGAIAGAVGPVGKGPGTSSGSAPAGSADKIPLLCTASFAESDAHIWVDQRGVVGTLDSSGINGGGAGGGGGGGGTGSARISAGVWCHVTVVVDCLEGGDVRTFVDGKLCTVIAGGASASSSTGAGKGSSASSRAGSSSIGVFDGPFSIGAQLALFGTKNSILCRGGGDTHCTA